MIMNRIVLLVRQPSLTEFTYGSIGRSAKSENLECENTAAQSRQRWIGIGKFIFIVKAMVWWMVKWVLSYSGSRSSFVWNMNVPGDLADVKDGFPIFRCSHGRYKAATAKSAMPYTHCAEWSRIVTPALSISQKVCGKGVVRMTE